MTKTGYARLKDDDKCLLSLYALFDVTSFSHPKVANIMKRLMMKDSYNLNPVIERLKSYWYLEMTSYDWRQRCYDYDIRERCLIPFLLYMYDNERELLFRIANEGKCIGTTALKTSLWIFVESGFKTVILDNVDIYEQKRRIDVFMPALLKKRFQSYILQLDNGTFGLMLQKRLEIACVDEEILNTGYLRSMVDSYKSNRFVYTRLDMTAFIDYYDYVANGVRPKTLSSENFSHRLIAGIHETYQENYDSACAHFKQALIILNKLMRANVRSKVKSFADPIANFFYVMAAYLSNNNSMTKAVEAFEKGNDDNSASRILQMILANAVSDNVLANEVEKLMSSEGYDINETLATLMMKYLDRKSNIPECAPKFLILENEFRKYRPMDEKRERIADSVYCRGGVLSSIYHRQDWEAVLDELTDDNSKRLGTEQNVRIAYFLSSINSDSVQIRQQSILKSGAWSSGKSVSLQNYLSGMLEGMSDGDHNIRALLLKDRYYSYEIPLKYVLPVMVNENRLYVGQYAPYTLVEVTEETPYITLERDSSGFTIHSNVPRNKAGSDVIITHRGASSINFISIPEKQKPFYSRLLSLDRFPLEAEDRLRKFLSAIGDVVEVNTDLVEGGSTLPIVDGNPQLVLQLCPIGSDIYQINLFVRPLDRGRVKCQVGKGETVISDNDENGMRIRVRRDVEKEKDNLKMLYKEIGLFQNLYETLDVGMSEVLTLLDFALQYPEVMVCEWPKGARVRIKKSSAYEWSCSINKNVGGWFDIEGNVKLEQGKVISMAQLLDLMNYSDGRFVRLAGDEFLALSDGLRKQLDTISTIASRSRGKLKLSPFSAALIGADMLGGELQLSEDDELKAIRMCIKESSNYNPCVPKELKATLRNYQIEGYQWMMRLANWGAGALLADDMGLGKTVQSIAFILSKASEGATLVVAPASVAPNWLTEFEKFAPSMNVSMLNFVPDRKTTISNATKNDVVVATYGMLLSEKDSMIAKKWATICLDEAHTIKNREAKTSGVAMRLNCKYRIMLTGTPVQNHLGELWSLFQFLNPGLLGLFEDFKDRFIIPIALGDNMECKLRLDRLVKPFMLRRTKDKVANELPDKQEIYRHVEMTEEESLVYEVLRRRAEEMLQMGGGSVSMKALAEITRLRLCACDSRLVDEVAEGVTADGSKIVALVELLQTIIEGLKPFDDGMSTNQSTYSGGVLVFSQFTSYLALIKEALDAASIPYLYMDGNIDIKTRQKLVRSFQAGKCPVFLISLKAGGLGLNLTRANYVIHMDPWWNPAIEAQATDRSHRIGQVRKVTVYHLIAKGTIEEKIQRLHEHKQALVHDILEGTDMSYKLTGEQLLEMVSER